MTILPGSLLCRTDIARIYRDCYGNTRFEESEYLFAKAIETKVRADIEAALKQLQIEKSDS